MAPDSLATPDNIVAAPGTFRTRWGRPTFEAAEILATGPESRDVASPRKPVGDDTSDVTDPLAFQLDFGDGWDE